MHTKVCPVLGQKQNPVTLFCKLCLEVTGMVDGYQVDRLVPGHPGAKF